MNEKVEVRYYDSASGVFLKSDSRKFKPTMYEKIILKDKEYYVTGITEDKADNLLCVSLTRFDESDLPYNYIVEFRDIDGKSIKTVNTNMLPTENMIIGINDEISLVQEVSFNYDNNTVICIIDKY